MHHQWAHPPLRRKHQHQQWTLPLLRQALCRPSHMHYVNKRLWLHSRSRQGWARKLPQSSLMRRLLKNNFSVMSVLLFIPTKAVCISTNGHVMLSIHMHVSTAIWLSLMLTCCTNIWTLTLRSLVSCVPSVGNNSILCTLWIYTDVKFTKCPQNINVQKWGVPRSFSANPVSTIMYAVTMVKVGHARIAANTSGFQLAINITSRFVALWKNPQCMHVSTKSETFHFRLWYCLSMLLWHLLHVIFFLWCQDCIQGISE